MPPKLEHTEINGFGQVTLLEKMNYNCVISIHLAGQRSHEIDNIQPNLGEILFLVCSRWSLHHIFLCARYLMNYIWQIGIKFCKDN